ncbi:condensation domain-containing protein [Streptomyces tricolor]|nr:condensation domain-containing protein [Streptomyces tricolor]
MIRLPRGPAAPAVDLPPSDPGRLEPGPGAHRCVRGYAALTTGTAPRPPARRAVRRLCALAGRPGTPRPPAPTGGPSSPGSPPPTPLPADRVRPRGHETRSGHVHTAGLSDAVSARLARTARAAGLTLGTVVQGASGCCCPATAPSPTCCSGPPSPDRPDDLPGVESMVGMFINTLPTRVRVDGGRTATAWLRELQEAQAEARRFAAVSLAELTTLSDVPAGTPLFDSMVAFENYPFDQGPLGRHRDTPRGRLRPRRHQLPPGAAGLPGRAVRLDLAYDPELFDATTVRSLADRLCLLLTELADDPDRPVRAPSPGRPPRNGGGSWPTATAPRRAAPPSTLDALFAAQAAHPPHAEAVSCGEDRLDYATLDARAGRLAHRLAELRRRTREVRGARAAPLHRPRRGRPRRPPRPAPPTCPSTPALPAERVRQLLADTDPVALVTTTATAVGNGRTAHCRWTTPQSGPTWTGARPRTGAPRPAGEPPTPSHLRLPPAGPRASRRPARQRRPAVHPHPALVRLRTRRVWTLFPLLRLRLYSV